MTTYSIASCAMRCLALDDLPPGLYMSTCIVSQSGNVIFSPHKPGCAVLVQSGLAIKDSTPLRERKEAKA